MDTRLRRTGRVVVVAALATLGAEMAPPSDGLTVRTESLQGADAPEQALEGTAGIDEIIVATTEP
ncbi:MAG: hypothetical protein WED01_03305 [Candidatus Rokuibacteriota bacterium]